MKLGLGDKAWWTRLGPPGAFQFASMAALVMLRSAANAQVLSRFHAGALPYLFVLVATLTMAASAWVAHVRWGGWWTPGRAAVGGALLAWALGGAVLFGVAPAALGSYLFVETFATLVTLSFWARAGKMFEPHEFRRAFATLSGIGMAGVLCGGLLSRVIAMHLGTGLLPFAGAALLVVAAAIFRVQVLPTREPTRVQSHRSGSPPPIWRELQEHPFARTLAIFVFVLALSSSFIDFLFRQRADVFLDENGLAALFGTMQLWIGIAATGFHLVWAHRLIRHRGTLRYLVVVPGLLLAFSVAALFTPALWPVYALKGLDGVLTYSLLPIAVQLLYSPVADDLRDRLRIATEGFIRKGGLGLTGVVLWCIATWATGALVPATVAALGFLGGMLLLWLRPSFIRVLEETIARALRNELPLTPSDESQLVSALSSSEPERALRALSMMSAAEISPRPHLEALLGHADERVVERALQLTVELKAEESTFAIERLLLDGPKAARPEAAWTLAQLSPTRAKALLPSQLESTDAALRCASLGALLSLEPEGDAIKVLDAMTRLGVRAAAAERREVARLLGRLRNERHAEQLAQYLEDGDAGVRKVAINAVGVGRYLSLAPRLLPFLTWREERRIARESLVSLGNDVLPLLERALNDRTRSPALRGELPRVLRQLKTQQALEALLFSNLRDDAYLHHRVGVALARMRDEAPHLVADEASVLEAIGRRREIYRRLVESYRDLSAALGPDSLVTRAIGDRLDQAYEVSFWLLGLLHPPKVMRRLHLHLVGGDAKRRTKALAELETLVPDKHRELLNEQTEDFHRSLSPGDPSRLSWHLSTLCHSGDAILRNCARHIGRAHGFWNQPRLEDEMSEQWVTRLFALEGVEMFAQCDVDDLSAVAALAREEKYQKGERIYDLGDPGDALFVIQKGRVLADIQGQEVLTFGEKEAFGEVSLLDGAPRPTGATALEDTTLLVIERQDFLDLISDRPQLLKSVFRAAMRQFAHVIQFPRRKSALEAAEARDLALKTGSH